MRGYIRKRCTCGRDNWPRCRHSWAITVSAGIDPITGERRQVFRTARTKAEAEREMTAILQSLDAGTLADPGRLLLGDYLTRWLDHMTTRVRPRTHLRYQQLVDIHIRPILGNVRLRDVRPAHVQQVLDAMAAAGLAPRTRAGAYRVLHGLLKQATRWQLLATNPASAVQPPRAERPVLSVPDAATVSAILRATTGTRLHLPLAIAAGCGLRRGEILAIRWRSLDLDAGRVEISASLQKFGGALQFVEPKTSRGRRRVTLPPALVASLRQHRREQLERRVLLGETWTDLDLVIERGDGQPLSPDSLSRDWYRLVRRLRLPELRLHDLRHAFATRLLEANVHPKIVSEALGHSSVSFTLDTYSHVLIGLQDQAAQAIADALGSTLGE